MRGPQPPAIVLSAGERQELETLVRRHTTHNSWPSAHVLCWPPPRLRIIARLSASWQSVSTWCAAGERAGSRCRPSRWRRYP